jgi:hypothetical protein
MNGRVSLASRFSSVILTCGGYKAQILKPTATKEVLSRRALPR